MSETPKGPENPGHPDQTEKFGPDFQQKLQNLESGVSLEEQEVIAALPSGSALLIVRKGPNAGARFLLDQDSTIAGRHPEADIFLDDVTVSRRHAEFVRHGTAFEVKDMGSLNGTYVNQERVEEILLQNGDELQVGKYRMVFFDGASN